MRHSPLSPEVCFEAASSIQAEGLLKPFAISTPYLLDICLIEIFAFLSSLRVEIILINPIATLSIS